MARIWADRVRETSTTTGTGTLSLGGALTGFRAFDDVMADGDTCYYVIVMAGDWEVGLGTFTSGSPDTLARTSVLASSNAGALVNFGAGTKDVFLDFPADVADKATRESIIIACSDETTALTTGVAKVTFRMPYAFTLTGVRSSVTTAPTGATLIVDINESGSTILSTKLSIDASEKTSTTAASAAVISDTLLADDAEITIDIDQVGSTIAGAGLKVALLGYRT